jgi:very-short-patch-repair endonuclease
MKNGQGKFCSLRCATIYKNIYQKKHDTDIERLIENELIRRNIPYTKQVPLLGITLVDFLLPNDTVIYADGEFWHDKPEVIKRDANQDFILTFYGYKVYRFTDKEIKKSAKKCVDKIIKIKGENP